MRKIVSFDAAAFVLGLGASTASAQPTPEQRLNRGQTGIFETYALNSSGVLVQEGRAAAVEASGADSFVFHACNVR